MITKQRRRDEALQRLADIVSQRAAVHQQAKEEAVAARERIQELFHVLNQYRGKIVGARQRERDAVDAAEMALREARVLRSRAAADVNVVPPLATDIQPAVVTPLPYMGPLIHKPSILRPDCLRRGERYLTLRPAGHLVASDTTKYKANNLFNIDKKGKDERDIFLSNPDALAERFRSEKLGGSAFLRLSAARYHSHHTCGADAGPQWPVGEKFFKG